MTLEPGFFFQILAVFLGGGSVQMLIFLFRRRAEIHELDAKADAIGLDAANNLISRLQIESQQLHQRGPEVRAEHLREIEEMTRRLTTCMEEGVRLQREIALLRNDLGITRQQVEQLLPARDYQGVHHRID